MRRRQRHNIEPFICYFRVTGDSGVVVDCMNCRVIFFEGSALSCFVAFWVHGCLSVLELLARWKKGFTFASCLCSSHYDANQIVPDYYFSFCATKGSLRNAIVELVVHSLQYVLPQGAFILGCFVVVCNFLLHWYTFSFYFYGVFGAAALPYRLVREVYPSPYLSFWRSVC